MRCKVTLQTMSQLFQWTGQVWHIKSASSTSANAFWRQFYFHSSLLYPSTLSSTRTVLCLHYTRLWEHSVERSCFEINFLFLIYFALYFVLEKVRHKGKSRDSLVLELFSHIQHTGCAQQWEERWCSTNRASAATSAHSLKGTPTQVA